MAELERTLRFPGLLCVIRLGGYSVFAVQKQIQFFRGVKDEIVFQCLERRLFCFLETDGHIIQCRGAVQAGKILIDLIGDLP